MGPLGWIDAELAALEQQGLRRRLATRSSPQAPRLLLDGCPLINFGSNDYLGLAADPRLAAAVAQAVVGEGWGSGASPLLSGHSSLHARLEQRLAEMEGTEAALLFPSGFAANLGAIAALVGPGDIVSPTATTTPACGTAAGSPAPTCGSIPTATLGRWTACWPERPGAAAG